MSQYDGLNLPQLLDRMHELVLPEPVSWIPQTPGWWVLLAWLLAMAAFGAWQIGAYRHRNRYRREALRRLAMIESQAGRRPGTAAQIAGLLKRTALVAYPRRQVANLYAQVVAAAHNLAMAAYQPDVDGAALCQPARRWIQLHRA